MQGESSSSRDGELYVLARSGGRRDKEQAMRRRRLKKLVKRLHDLRQQEADPGPTADQVGSSTGKESGPAVLSAHRHSATQQGPAGRAGDILLQAMNWQKLREARRREGSYLLQLQSHRQRSGETMDVPIYNWSRSSRRLQGTQRGPGDPSDLPPNRRTHRSAYLRGVPGLLPAGHAQATAAVAGGAGTDAEIDAGRRWLQSRWSMCTYRPRTAGTASALTLYGTRA